MAANFFIRLEKQIVFPSHKALDWAKDGAGGEYAFTLFHNAAIPFPPFLGLSISCDIDLHSSKAAHKESAKVELNEVFESGKIVSVHWECMSEKFVCRVEPARLAEDDELGRLLWRSLREGWLPQSIEDESDIYEEIKKWQGDKKHTA